MAGTAGRAPKDPGHRRRYNQPVRGEWTDLPAKLDRAVLPAYRASFTIPRELWAGWRKDPICSQYTDGDVAAAVSLATAWVSLSESEQRLRYTALGLTPKGRRDLRWRTQLEAEQQREALTKVKEIRKLRVVAED